DARRYKSRSDRIVDQFNGYVGVDTMHVNGKLTLGENTADLGGLAVAYHALEHALEGKPRPLIDGFTPEQRFFLSYANVWRAKYRPEALRMQIATNPHSPAQWRVNGPLSNLPEFAHPRIHGAHPAARRAEDLERHAGGARQIEHERRARAGGIRPHLVERKRRRTIAAHGVHGIRRGLEIHRGGHELGIVHGPNVQPL